jgi:8-oxo-dGTP pyrophosphatase MutT (NUDIX family)
MADRYRSIIDAHILLRRAGEILLAHRAGDVYASGQYGLPSGHLEQGESILDAVIRETEEEVGIVLEPAALRMVLVMHQRNPGGHARIGFFSSLCAGTASPSTASLPSAPGCCGRIPTTCQHRQCRTPRRRSAASTRAPPSRSMAGTGHPATPK